MKDFDFSYKIIWQRRKTVLIRVDNKGNIEVKAPIGADIQTIEKFLVRHKTWISKRLQRAKKFKKYDFTAGEKFPLLGECFELTENHIKKSDCPEALDITGLSTDEIKQKIVSFYKQKLKVYINKRLEEFARQHNLTYNNVRITNARTRFGSCSSKKNLNFTWRLAMAIPKAVDYVIVHELAHTVEMNHSKKFWDLVEKMMPDYKIYKNWLFENSSALSLD